MDIDDIDPGIIDLIVEGDLDTLQGVLEASDFASIGHELLAVAASAKKAKIVRWLLESGVDPNAPVYGQTALFWAVYSGREEIVILLVSAGAKVVPKRIPDDGSTALHHAAEHRDPDIVRYLIEQAGGTEAFLVFDELDKTPLHRAVRKNNLATAKVLLEAGADPNALVHVHHEGRIGDTPLRDAVYEGYVEMARLLLSYGADPDRPGWMWLSARNDLERLTEAVRAEMEALLYVAPMRNPEESAHLPEIEKQLYQDLKAHRFANLELSWEDASISGDTVQVRGERLAPFQGVKLRDPSGKVVGLGDFNFLILTVEMEFRVFWSRIEVEQTLLAPGAGDIPRHVWDALTADQQSW